jgi:GlpG protein
MGVVTLALIVLCVGAAGYTGFSWHPVKLHPLFMSEQPMRILPEVRQGEFWRLITPIFVHFGPIHLLFNMLWLKVLGASIESRDGSWKFSLLVLFLALASNFTQFYWQGPIFGGMSGVVYGLFGYVWIRAKTDPFSGYFMPKETVYTMIAWFFLCVFQVIPNIANGAHAGGLVAGMAVGALPRFLRH